MLAFLRTFLAVLLALAVAASVPLLVGLVILVASQDPGIEAGTWLVVDLNEPLLEYYPPTTLRTIFRDRPTCLMEVLDGTDDMKTLIQQKALMENLREQAVKDGMTTLMQDGIRKIFEGVTDISQVRKVCIK